MLETLKKWMTALGAFLFVVTPGSSFIVLGWMWLKKKFSSTTAE